MLDNTFAQNFAQGWIAAWNSHDLERILSHYDEGFEMSSPLIAQLANEPSGVLKGKPAVAAYWNKALALLPDLHFELLTVFAGVNSITIAYQGHREPATEVLFFGANRQIIQAFAHYAP